MRLQASEFCTGPFHLKCVIPARAKLIVYDRRKKEQENREVEREKERGRKGLRTGGRERE